MSEEGIQICCSCLLMLWHSASETNTYSLDLKPSTGWWCVTPQRSNVSWALASGSVPGALVLVAESSLLQVADSTQVFLLLVRRSFLSVTSSGHNVLDKCLSTFKPANVQSIFLVILLSLIPSWSQPKTSFCFQRPGMARLAYSGNLPTFKQLI